MDIFLRMLWLISKIKFRYTRNLCMFNMFFAKKNKNQPNTHHTSRPRGWTGTFLFSVTACTWTVGSASIFYSIKLQNW